MICACISHKFTTVYLNLHEVTSLQIKEKKNEKEHMY